MRRLSPVLQTHHLHAFPFWFLGFSAREREREREQREQRERIWKWGGREGTSGDHSFHTVTQEPFHTYGALAKTTIYRNTRILEKELFWKKMISMGLLFKEKGFGSKDPMVFIEMTKVLRKEVCIENIFVKTLILNKKNLTKELI